MMQTKKNNQLKDILLECMENYKAHPLFYFAERGEKVTAFSYDRFIADLAYATMAAKKIPARRIAVIGYNSYEWIITTISLMLAGKVLILMNPDLRDEDLLHLLNYTDTEYIMFPENLRADFMFLEKDFPTGVFFSKDSGEVSSLNPSQWLSELPEQNSEFICFTSGTSKNSKGVVISLKTLVNHIRYVKAERCLPGNQGERSFLTVPFYHIYGLTFIFNLMEAGMTICASSSPRYIVKEAGLFNPHVAYLVPSMIESLFKGKPLMPLLYSVIGGGSPCRREQVELVRRQGIKYLNGYGSSESIALALLSREDGDEQWMRPLSCVQCGVSEEGELWMRLPYHMDEYYKRPEDTVLALDGDTLWTGDSAIMNENGDIKILGRLRDTIVMENGEKIHAEDMDRILMSMNYVKEAAVVYSVDFGLTAIIVPDPITQEEEIQEQVELYNKSTGPQFRIRRVWFRRKELPKTSTGKLKRYQLEAEYLHKDLSERGLNED